MHDTLLLGPSERVAASDAAATSWANTGALDPHVIRLISDIAIHVRVVLKDPGTDVATNQDAFLPANTVAELHVHAASKVSFLGKATSVSGFVWVTILK